jgi:hypothetical protein
VAGTKFDIQIPEFVKYELPQLQHVLKIMQSAKLTVGSDGTIALPPELEDLKIEIGQCIYRIGIGGLHTSEKQIAHKADADTLLIDKDVASYYPSIILNQHLAPKHLGKSFLKVYREIVNRRLAAKAAGNKLVAESLKITINGTFGKLGNPYSILYSGLHIQVTLSGQLCLLMLIEFIERSGIPVVSANTDGVVVKCPKNRYNYLEAAVVHWENITGFKTEETRYKAIYSRDVNNYIAVKEDNTIKVKGAYAERGSSGNSVLSKNPEHLICNDAVAALLTKGTPVEKTIRASKDIRRFVTIRNVKGGAEKSGVYLGRAVRWYYSTKIQGTINYRTNGNKVPNTDNAMPLMELPVEFPEDVDYEFYIRKANEILDEIGYNGSPLKFSFF